MGEVILVAVAYLLGAVPFGMLVARTLGGVDLRRVGSGNIGATNVLRAVGKGAAVLTLSGDMGKGAAVVAIGRAAGAAPPVLALMGLAAVLGHVFPVSLGFRGGKGVATTLGVVLVAMPAVGGLLLLIWLCVAGLTRYSSLSALVAALALPALAWVLDGRPAMIGLGGGATLRLVFCQLESFVDQRFVFDDALDLDAAGGREDDFGFGIVDAQRQFRRREAAENDGVDRTQTRHRQHADDRFRNHRHVDDDAVAFHYAQVGQHPGGACHRVGQLGVGVLRLGVGDGRVVDERKLVAAPVLHMMVQRHVGRVHLPVGEPVADAVGIVRQDLLRKFEPVQVLGLLAPEALRILHRTVVFCLVAHLHPPFIVIPGRRPESSKK